MVMRRPRPGAAARDRGRARPAPRARGRRRPSRLARSSSACVGRPPDYLDGHHHCHAGRERRRGGRGSSPPRLGVPVRSVDERHRAFLRERGVATPDLLVGRLEESEPALPPEIEAWLAGGDAAARGDASGSSTRATPIPRPGRPTTPAASEDLALLLELGDAGPLGRARDQALVARAGACALSGALAGFFSRRRELGELGERGLEVGRPAPRGRGSRRSRRSGRS